MSKDKVALVFFGSLALMYTVIAWFFLPYFGKEKTITEIIVTAGLTLFFWTIAFGWSLFCDSQDEELRRSKMFLTHK
jgi:hypothetical protein